MDAFKEREAAAEFFYIHCMEEAVAKRLRRIDDLGRWACAIMRASQDDELRYRDILYRLATASRTDDIVIDQVYNDLVRSGAVVTRAEIIDVLTTDRLDSRGADA